MNIRNYYGLKERYSIAKSTRYVVRAKERQHDWLIRTSPLSDESLAHRIIASLGATSEGDLLDALDKYAAIPEDDLPLPEWLGSTHEFAPLLRGAWSATERDLESPRHLLHPVFIAYTSKLSNSLHSLLTAHKRSKLHASVSVIVDSARKQLAQELGRLSSLLLDQEVYIESQVPSANLKASRAEAIGRYPLLLERSIFLSEAWQRYWLEITQRLSSDWSKIMNLFYPDTVGDLNICEINPEMGDKHGGGASVAVLTFDNGTQLLYKPKPQEFFSAYQAIVAHITHQTSTLRFRPLRTIHGDGYGWVEHVSFREAKSEVELNHFYQVAGIQLGVAYFLGITDLHRENIIAAGDCPYLVDVEAGFTPSMSLQDQTSKTFLNIGSAFSYESVLGTGLLPLHRLQGAIAAFADQDTSSLCA